MLCSVCLEGSWGGVRLMSLVVFETKIAHK